METPKQRKTSLFSTTATNSRHPRTTMQVARMTSIFHEAGSATRTPNLDDDNDSADKANQVARQMGPNVDKERDVAIRRKFARDRTDEDHHSVRRQQPPCQGGCESETRGDRQK